MQRIASGRITQGHWTLSRLTGTLARKAILLVLILAGLAVTMTPFLVSLYLALMKHTSPILPYRFSPSEWTLYNFRAAWPNMHIGEYGLNTLIYAGVISTIVTFNACLAGYIFARLDFPGKQILWYVVLVTMMIPAVVTFVPLLWQMIRFPLAGGNNIFGQGGRGFYDTWPGLILPALFGSGATFLMRQFFLTLPADLEDAARVDGCGELEIFLRIMLPLATPGAVTVFLFEFQGRWNALMWPLMITSSDRLRTLAVAFSNMSQLVFGSSPGAANPVHWAQAAAIMMALPIILLFIFGQRFFTRGIALTGIK
jgi:multiple sugar transport system permease protein